MVTSFNACGDEAPERPSEPAKEIELPKQEDQVPEPAVPPWWFMKTQLEAEPGWKYDDLTHEPVDPELEDAGDDEAGADEELPVEELDDEEGDGDKEVVEAAADEGESV